MSSWSLPSLLDGLHDSVQHELRQARELMGHSVGKGDASEGVWLKLLRSHLPARYSVERAVVVDSENRFSDALDVVIFDRQYSPFILSSDSLPVIPAESVYAVFEAKQEINAKEVAYAHDKVSSVRHLYRTSLTIPSAGGPLPAKKPAKIIGGILALDSGWTNPALGNSLKKALAKADDYQRLDIGCVAEAGWFENTASGFAVKEGSKSATSFLFRLLSILQSQATVPMIDVEAYAKWLK